MDIQIIEQATAEPVTLEEARRHIYADAYYDSPGFDSPEPEIDDEDVRDMITTAREWAEGWTGRSLTPKTYRYSSDGFPSTLADGTTILELPNAPIQEIVQFAYTDSAGGEQFLDNGAFQLDPGKGFKPARIAPSVGSSWPGVQAGVLFGGVRIDYVAGYSLPGDSPSDARLPITIKRALLLVVGHLYENREDTSATKLETIPLGAQSLLRRYRLERGMA